MDTHNGCKDWKVLYLIMANLIVHVVIAVSREN